MRRGVACLDAQAAPVKPEEEYRKLIRVNEEIQPLGEHPFGESINLYDGALSFEEVDVSASGSGPLLQLLGHLTPAGTVLEAIIFLGMI
ncbi:hypothetical protein ACFWZ3_00170 [Frateuria sp. GZRR35]|uniref:hypothetical protein n=1 Tax=Frateuria sp. GZRR35 TaxID=3351536 RepID=UPI003EDBC8E2